MTTIDGADPVRIDDPVSATLPKPLSRLLDRSWDRVTRHPVPTLARAAAIAGAAAVVVNWAGTPIGVIDTPFVDLPTTDWFVDRVGPAAAARVGALWALVSVVVGVAAVLISARTLYSATTLAVLPFVSVFFLGTHAVSMTVTLVAVTCIVALRDPLAALVPGTLTLGVLWIVHPFFYGARGSGWSEVMTLPMAAQYSALFVAGYVVAAGCGAWVRGRSAVRAGALVERRAVAVESQAAERARISRDLHDVVAHHVSLVAVRAESAPFQHPDLGADARTVLAEIAGDARSALGELRHVLTVLQRSEDPELAPQPTASDVEDLVTVAIDAGQDVDVTGDWGHVPADVGYVLFRATQEVLTNARRHAPGGRVHLVRTRDDGRARLITHGSGTTVAAGQIELGRGLIGMRERVESVGGTFDIGAPDGVFTLTISIPVSEDER